MNTPKAKNAVQEAQQDTSSAAAPAQPQAQAAAAAADAGTALVPAEAQAPEPDEHHGKGGLYQLVNGQRVLVEQTKTPD